MRPNGYVLSGKKGLVLKFTCEKCGEQTSNVAAHEGHAQPDDYDRILTLSKPTF
jgi:hypothetical protein